MNLRELITALGNALAGRRASSLGGQWFRVSIPLPTWYANKRKMTYFTEAEIAGLDKELVAMLEMARHVAGVPFIINSGLRTPEDNEASGGKSDSAHLKGLAVDLRCLNSSDRYFMLKGLFKAGFKRIEVATAHLHVDVAGDKAQNVCWLGVSN